MFKIILVDPNAELCIEWNKEFNEYEEVRVVNGYFEDLPEYDCMVSAANSFGLMDGGVDLAITNYFGEQLQANVQRYIIAYYFGEQPVGTSFIIETGNAKHPFLAHTPTMRVPTPINGTDNVYMAMKAMLEAVWRHNEGPSPEKIFTIACPGLGTSAGRMRASEAARQMKLAYKNFLSPPDKIDWRFAGKRQQEIKYGTDLGYRS